ncbi:cation:proton antiporter [Frankia sp. Cj3]|uniref:cation:proton antiporter n=1 Tax=Frankia sp. Cj3 TaxID=2880976 RepID=UPI001EF40CE8|nr:cation:proton antiporter [Frankia sp. Cj3]
MAYASGPVATLSSQVLLIFLLQIAVLLGLAHLLGRAATRLAMPAVVGELVTGVLLGPSLLGTLAPGFAGWLLPARADQFHLLDAAGQLGVILLVGFTGMDMDIRLVRRRSLTVVRVGLAGLLVPVGLGAAGGLLLPDSLVADGANRPVFAMFLGVALGVSAIPVAAKILIDMHLLDRNVGQLTLAAAAVDDAVGWSMLSVVSAMATTGVHGGDIAVPVVSVLGTVLVALVAGRPVVRAALRFAGAARDGSGCIPVVTVLILAAAAATDALKLEAIFGAFIAGIVVGSSRDFIPDRVAPLRTVVLTVLAPIFFATAGLRVDLGMLTDPPVLAAGLVVLLLAVAGKFGGVYLGARAGRLGHWEALALGAGLNARGVIGLVVAAVGLRLGVLGTAAYTVVVLVALVTTVMTPPILRITMRRVERTVDETLAQQLDPAAGTGAHLPGPDVGSRRPQA